MPPVPFQGRIPVDGHATYNTSAFGNTDWDNTTPTVPAQTPTAWSETSIDTATDNAEEHVRGLNIVENTWR